MKGESRVLRRILQEKHMSVYECARKSGIPYMTLSDLVNHKTDMRKCSVDTLFRLSQTLGISMDAIVKSYYEVPVTDFEAFKSTISHQMSKKGDLLFMKDVLESNTIRQLWNEDKYKECFYLLAMVDYLSAKNNISLVSDYDDIRENKLLDPLYPRDIEIMDLLFPKKHVKDEFKKKAIKEFSKFNIYESEVGNVY